MTANTLFVTGTDTGIGKTLASTALLYALRERGRRVAGMKPVASGSEPGEGGWRNDDALALQAASDPQPSYADVNPYALPQPTAPQLAARAAGVRVSPGVLAAAHARLSAGRDVVVVEGAGGWLAPLADGLEHAMLARSLDAEVLLVVGLRLGCLNHARLTARAIEDDGLRLAGWIGSMVDAGFGADYLALVEEALPAPCLGVLPHQPDPDARAAARSLRLPADW